MRAFVLLLVLVPFAPQVLAKEYSLLVSFDNSSQQVFEPNQQVWREFDSATDGLFQSELETTELTETQSASYHAEIFKHCNSTVPDGPFEKNMFGEVNEVLITNGYSILGLKDQRFSLLYKGDQAVSLHCAAGIEGVVHRPNLRYVAFVGKELDSVTFYNNKIDLWVPNYTDHYVVHLYDTKSGAHYSVSHKNEIFDFQIDEDGRFYGLTVERNLSLSSPKKIVAALAGHPHSKYEYEFWTYNPSLDKREKLPLPNKVPTALVWVKNSG